MELDNRFIAFGTKHLGKELTKVSMLIMLEFIRSRLNYNQSIKKDTWVYVDEAHELTEEEFYLAGTLASRYAKPSIYDCIALAIAKIRGLTLLTGDGPLRKAAVAEGVKVVGTIGILDQLYVGNYIEDEEYSECIQRLIDKNGGKVRLPKHELEIRLQRIKK